MPGRAIVGGAIGQTIDARLTVAASRTAIDRRKPSAGFIHHADRGSRYAAQIHRQLLADQSLVEAIYPMAFETFDDVDEYLPHFIEEVYNKRRFRSAFG